jgi:bifunctional non-homologous end joining protein LigD
MAVSRVKEPAGAVRTEVLPQQLEPELATLVDRPRPGNWLYEIKFDGYRMLARIEGKSVKIITRRGNDWTSRFEPLRAALQAAKLPPGWYDGEIVVLDNGGKPSFNALQNAIDAGTNASIVFYLFDTPFMDGLDLRKVAVEDRRAMLRSVLKETDTLRFSQKVEGEPHDIVASACKLGLEGIIGKRRGSRYLHGRSEDWIKLKCVKRQEFVIGGYTWPDESRSDAGIGALLVGYVDDAGVLQYAGKVGTGFTGEVSAMLRRRLDSIAQPKRPFAGPTGHDKHAQWVRPELVCEVAYNEWPEGGSLRHPSFKGMREDKPAPAVKQERPKALAMAEAAAPKTARTQARARGKARTSAHEMVRVTHADRVIDGSTGLTKMDLVRYYAEVSRCMLPHLAGRPVYIARFPEGIEGIRIFQQHPEGMRGFKGTDPSLWPGHEPAISIETAEDLVEAAQMDAIEIHTWNSTAKAITLPDRLVFDLDPGEGVAWSEIREGALLVKALLDELGLKSWVKTTGGKALHIFVPLKPELDYPTVRGFSEALVSHLARTIPQRFVAKSGPRNRVGRIFIDYLRNGRSQSTAEAFSARARPGLGVSMPVGWDDLPAIDSGAHWNITNAPDFLASRKKDPWAGYWKTKQSLRGALAELD